MRLKRVSGIVLALFTSDAHPSSPVASDFGRGNGNNEDLEANLVHFSGRRWAFTWRAGAEGWRPSA